MSSSISVFCIKRGDTLPELTRRLEDANGPVDLTGASVRFLMSYNNTGVTAIDAPAEIVDAPTGNVAYVWEDGQTNTDGDYNAEFEVTFSDGRVLTFPNQSFIRVTIARSVDDPTVAPPVVSPAGQPRQAVGVFVRKASVGTLTKFTPVYPVGFDAGYLTVEAATLANPAVGVLAADITDADSGFAQNFGLMVGLNTSSFTLGDRLFLADAGGVTTIEGAGRQFLGTVIEVHVTDGVVLLALA